MILLAELYGGRTALRLARRCGDGELKLVAGYIGSSSLDARGRLLAIEAFLEREEKRPDSLVVARPSANGSRTLTDRALRNATGAGRILGVTPAVAVASAVLGRIGSNRGSDRGRRMVLHADGKLDAAMIGGRDRRPEPVSVALADPVYSGPLELDYLCYASEVAGRPSLGRILSDRGVELIYRFLRDRVGYHEPEWMARSVRDCGGVTKAVAGAIGSVERTCRLARATAGLLATLLRSEAINLALRAGAAGGTVLAGKLARIAFRAKGPHWPQAPDGVEPAAPVIRKLTPELASRGSTGIYGLTRLAQRELTA